jgi:hypothetical protein
MIVGSSEKTLRSLLISLAAPACGSGSARDPTPEARLKELVLLSMHQGFNFSADGDRDLRGASQPVLSA